MAKNRRKSTGRGTKKDRKPSPGVAAMQLHNRIHRNRVPSTENLQSGDDGRIDLYGKGIPVRKWECKLMPSKQGKSTPSAAPEVAADTPAGNSPPTMLPPKLPVLPLMPRMPLKSAREVVPATRDDLLLKRWVKASPEPEPTQPHLVKIVIPTTVSLQKPLVYLTTSPLDLNSIVFPPRV